ncbi:MAG: tetratricopeptide repeat protein [Planctomycetes bacterium]|nr:tetratricopeptide repeat protein [Planctomycetota bacterium]
MLGLKSPRDRLATLVLLGLVVLPWINSFGGVFVFDDDRVIVNGETIGSVLPLGRFWATKRPLVELSLALNHAISGFETWSYHLVNLLIHLGCVLLLCALLRRLLELQPRRPAWLPEPAAFSFALALLWGVHPVQTETVTYLAQRAESLMTLGYLATLLFWLRARSSARPWPFLIGALAAAWFAMWSKQVAVTLPAAILLIELCLRGQPAVTGLKVRAVGLVLVASALGQTLLSGLLVGATRGVHGGRAAVGFTLEQIGPLDYLLSQTRAIWAYLGLVVAPVGLCLDHGWTVTRSFGAVVLPGLGVLGLLAAVVWALIRRPFLGLAGAFFFLVLAPTSSFVPIRDLFVEHRIYLAMIGPLVLLGLLVCRFIPGPGARRLALGLAFVVLATLTVIRNQDYHDVRGMWEDVVAKAPENPRGHYSLGVLDARAGNAASSAREAQRDHESAIRRARRALELDPEHLLSWVLISSSEIALGRFEAAEEAARRAIAIDDDVPIAYTNLGDALDRQGRIPEAIEAHRKAIRAKKKFPSPHVDLAELLIRTGELDEAESRLDFAKERGAEALAPYWQARGVLARRRGRYDEAITAYRRALAIAPGMEDARRNLAIALLAVGRYPEAVDEVGRVVAANPGVLKSWLLFGTALGLAGDFPGAVKALERAALLFAGQSPGNSFPAAAQLDLARARLAALDRHEAALRDAGAGLGAGELALQAEIALARGERAEALALGRRALAVEPTLADDLERSLVYRLARAAFELAAEGRNERLVEGLELLGADLDRRAAQIASGGVAAEAARQALGIWRADAALAPLWTEGSSGPDEARRQALVGRIDALLGRR